MPNVRDAKVLSKEFEGIVEQDVKSTRIWAMEYESEKKGSKGNTKRGAAESPVIVLMCLEELIKRWTRRPKIIAGLQ
ncbi:MAG: hypothetical protein J0M24_21730 [Verrucomicrobia bacterium]|nr:hypothetical protein [Verrucomicrobiota bacterium]